MRSRGAHMLDELRDYLVHRHAVGFGAVVDEDAVAQDGRGKGFDVVACRVGTAGEERTGLCAEHEELSRPRAGTPAHPLVHKVGRSLLLRARGCGEAHGVAHDGLGDGHAADELLRAGVSMAHLQVIWQLQCNGGELPMGRLAELLGISVSNATPAAAAGQGRILAVLESSRYTKLPDTPSMTELIPTFRKPSSWFGVFGPPGLPAEITAKLNAEMGKALASPDVKAKLEGVGLTVIGGSPEAFGALLKDGIERYGTIIKEAGIQPN